MPDACEKIAAKKGIFSLKYSYFNLLSRWTDVDGDDFCHMFPENPIKNYTKLFRLFLDLAYFNRSFEFFSARMA